MSEKEKISFEKGISPIIPYKEILCKDVEPQSYSCAYHIYLPWKCKFAWEDDSKLEPKLVSIDKCLLHEITHLWEIGIKTTGCCCGHGDLSKAFISVHPAYIETMKELGYTTYYNKFNPDAKDHFVPKTIFRYKYGIEDISSLASEY